MHTYKNVLAQYLVFQAFIFHSKSSMLFYLIMLIYEFALTIQKLSHGAEVSLQNWSSLSMVEVLRIKLRSLGKHLCWLAPEPSLLPFIESHFPS